MKKICKFILKAAGWSVKSNIDFPQKCVICVAPHTSNWDFPIGLIVYTSVGQRASFLMKKDWFFFPMNLIFKWLGGIPVNRSKKTSLTDQIAAIFKSKESFQLAITPEGTRKANAEWKMGFYYIALAAEVPIVVASFDYKNKEVEFHKEVIPTGDLDADLVKIKDCYRNVTARFPENFIL